jgi:hypothetical protein
MIWQQALKYPMLVIGIILFSLFIMDENTSKWWNSFSTRFIPSTCNAVKERIAPKAPNNWTIECPGTELLILNVSQNKQSPSTAMLRKYLYRELANTYVNFAKFSNPETLSQLQNLKVNIDHPQMKIESISDGEAVVKFITMKDQNMIIRHLGATVKVKEIIK